MEAEIGERIKEEEKNEEIRIERLKAKKEEKKEIREIANHKNSQNLIKEIVSEKRLSTRIDKQDKDPLKLFSRKLRQLNTFSRVTIHKVRWYRFSLEICRPLK